MKLRILAVVAGLAVAAFSAGAASAQSIYLKAADIPGAATANNRAGWIEVESLSEGVANSSQPAGGAGARAGKTSFQDISLSRRVDAASLKLREFAITGKRLPQVEIEFVASGPGQQVAYRIVLKDVGVSSVSTSMSKGGGAPVEAVSINFGEISWVLPQPAGSGPAGTTQTFGWNLGKNAKP